MLNDYNGKIVNGHLLKLNWTNLNMKNYNNLSKKNNYKNETNNYTVSFNYLFF